MKVIKIFLTSLFIATIGLLLAYWAQKTLDRGSLLGTDGYILFFEIYLFSSVLAVAVFHRLLKIDFLQAFLVALLVHFFVNSHFFIGLYLKLIHSLFVADSVTQVMNILMSLGYYLVLPVSQLVFAPIHSFMLIVTVTLTLWLGFKVLNKKQALLKTGN